MARDSQKSRLYAAEKEFKTGPHPEYRKVAQIEEFIAEMIATNWWQARYPHIPHIRVKDGRGTRIARGSSLAWQISLPLWARTREIILHEVAHVLTPSHLPAHGREYAQVYYDLLLRFCGPETADKFVIGCIEHRVKIGRRRPGLKVIKTSPEQIYLGTGEPKLPEWASEGATFHLCTVFAYLDDGPMRATGEIRAFSGVRDAHRWAKARRSPDVDVIVESMQFEGGSWVFQGACDEPTIRRAA